MNIGAVSPQAWTPPQRPNSAADRIRQSNEDAAEGCETCKNRRYQDGSDDASVSYQVPTNIPAEQAAVKVRSHEMEHVRHEKAKAER